MAAYEILFEAVDQASPAIQRLSQQFIEMAQKSDQYAAGITNANIRAAQSFSQVAPKAQEASNSLSTVQQAGSQLLNQFLTFATVGGVIAFFHESAEAALGHEEALRRVGFAVEATGGSFASQKGRIIEFAEEQKNLTRFSETDTLEVMSRLVRVTGDVGQAMQGTRLVFGLASASGKDFNSVLDQLAPILNGNASRIRGLQADFGSFIGNATTAQGVIDALSKKFLGAAEQEDGFARQLASSKNQLESFKETVGAGILPVFEVLLQGLARGAEAFEFLGLAIGSVMAGAFTQVEAFGQAVVAVLTGDFGKLPAIMQDMGAKFISIVDETSNEATKIEARYSTERVKTTEDEVELKAKVRQKDVDHAEKEAEAKKKAQQDAHDTLVRLNAQELDLQGQTLESKLKIIDLEKQAKLRQLDEMKQNDLITQKELDTARQEEANVAALQAKKAKDDLDEVDKTAEAVGKSMAKSMGTAVADMILKGKSFEDAMKAVFDSVLRTAIETFTKIAVEAAIAQVATEGVTGGGGGGFFSAFGMAEGGVVTKPTLAVVGESGPEAVIPLDRAGGLGQPAQITVQQTNHFEMSGTSDDQVRQIMRSISDVTRSGAAEGAEMVKSIMAQQDRLAGQSV